MHPPTSGRAVAAAQVLPPDIFELDKDDIIAAVCHKLRTPLTSAMGFVQLCLRDAGQRPECTGQLRNLEIVDQQLHKLAHMVDELARQAGLENGE